MRMPTRGGEPGGDAREDPMREAVCQLDVGELHLSVAGQVVESDSSGLDVHLRTSSKEPVCGEVGEQNIRRQSALDSTLSNGKDSKRACILSFSISSSNSSMSLEILVSNSVSDMPSFFCTKRYGLGPSLGATVVLYRLKVECWMVNGRVRVACPS